MLGVVSVKELFTVEFIEQELLKVPAELVALILAQGLVERAGELAPGAGAVGTCRAESEVGQLAVLRVFDQLFNLLNAGQPFAKVEVAIRSKSSDGVISLPLCARLFVRVEVSLGLGLGLALFTITGLGFTLVPGLVGGRLGSGGFSGQCIRLAAFSCSSVSYRLPTISQSRRLRCFSSTGITSRTSLGLSASRT